MKYRVSYKETSAMLEKVGVWGVGYHGQKLSELDCHVNEPGMSPGQVNVFYHDHCLVLVYNGLN